MTRRAPAILLLAMLSWTAASGGPAKLDDVRVYLVLTNDTKVIGELAAYDAQRVLVRDRRDRLVSVRWDQMKPVGCYHLQRRLTDPNSAEVNFRLGYYCKRQGLHADSQKHFSLAMKLDPSYQEKVRRVALNQYSGRVELAVALSDPNELAELERLEREGERKGHAAPAISPPARIQKYQKFSAAVQKRALEQIRTFGDQVNKKLDLKLANVETDHFVFFTDWPEVEQRPLSVMFERIYDRLSRQFDIPVDDNIYLGKLPVFAFRGKDDFWRFVKEADQATILPASVAYVRGMTTGYQHMALFRYSNALVLEKVVTHECVHTFVNRFQSNRPLEGWLNEGLAEVMAGILVPRSRTLERARAITRQTVARPVDFKSFMSGYGSPPGGVYPLCTTMVDYLIRKDPARFLDMVSRIKNGAATEAAMKASYGLDYDQFIAAWRAWARGNFPKPS